MASSYSTSLGIEKMGTGDQSGAWGTTSNHNWDIIDRITAYTSVALSGTTHTLTVREASPGSGTENLQDGMYRVIKFTGALGANNTVTIAPNTAKVFFIIINATTDSGSSGPYSVILTQGSGANITVQNGNNAVVYCDGAGSGAVVTDALSDLQIGNDLSLVSDSAILNMGADNDITITHVADVGLKLKQAGATGDGSPFILTLQTGELDIAAADVLGQIDFQAPNEATGTDAILVAAGIAAVSEGDFSSSNNATKLSFKTAASGAAAETASLSSTGVFTATNLAATGDTSASDNAAIGYTSAEGLILTGQGSTNDVTIKNDADADVITIATGATNVDIVGDVTASTVNADGDTAAGDNATMGYTSAEGLILTGQGSTNDVTIKNDADADVLTIPTGATGVVLAGALNIGGITTLGGAIAGADNQVGRVNLKDYGEVTSALGSAGGARTIDLENGNSFSATVSTGTVTWTFSNPTASDELCGFTLTQVNGGSQTVNWPGSVDWAGGTAPTLTSSGTDVLVFYTIDGGTIWHGMMASADSK